MKTILFYLLGALLFSSVAFGGDPYNGPETEGFSIPTSADDYKLTFSELRKAYGSCMKGVFMEIRSQMPGQGDRDDFWECVADIYDSSQHPGLSYISPYCSENCHTGEVAGCLSAEIDDDKRESLLLIENWYPEIASKPNLFLTVEYPVLTFKAKEGAIYDEYGQVSQRVHFLSDLALHLPKDFGEAVAMKNKATNQPTKVTVNLVKFRDCLSALIQN